MPPATIGRARIPLTIVGGFLGSGKTTLLNHIITNANGRRFAVVVNDFGAINIDARLIVAVEGQTVALTNGCVCCVIRDDLVSEVLALCRRDDPPEHIIIECSGVSKPVAVVDSFFLPEVATFVEVQTIVTLLDADLAIDEAATYADLAFAQVAVADLVVINKTDLVAPSRLAALRQRVGAIVPRARVLETSFAAVPMELLFDHAVSAAAAERGQQAGQHEGHRHHHGPSFATWTYRDDRRSFSFDAVHRFVERLPLGIVRAKGMVRLDLPSGESGVLQVTGRRGWLTLAPAGGTVATEIVFIGAPGTTTADELDRLADSAWREANDPHGSPHIVTDLRAFQVEFL